MSELKRFFFHHCCGCSGMAPCGMYEDKDGDYVKFEDVNTRAPVPSPWISVKERLPKPYDAVLVYSFPVCKIGVSFIIESAIWDNLPTGNNVTHWCPIPEPPKE